MTDRHPSAGPQPGLVVLQCPACGTPEPVSAGAIADRRIHMIVCRNCGETWPARAPDASVPADRAATADGSVAPILDAVRRPLVSYAGGRSDPWSAMLAADSRPIATPRRHGLAATATVAVLLCAAFLTLRPAAVAAVPDLAGLYAALGLPVNLDGLAIENVVATRSASDEGEPAPLTIAGTLRNIGGGRRSVPPFAVALTDADGRLLHRLTMASPVDAVPDGGSAAFALTVEAAPQQAREVVVSFADERRSAAAEGAGRP